MLRSVMLFVPGATLESRMQLFNALFDTKRYRLAVAQPFTSIAQWVQEAREKAPDAVLIASHIGPELNMGLISKGFLGPSVIWRSFANPPEVIAALDLAFQLNIYMAQGHDPWVDPSEVWGLQWRMRDRQVNPDILRASWPKTSAKSAA